MQHKSKKIFSESSTFFKNNDNSDAISSGRVMDGLRFSTKDPGCEKRHNCKLTALQTIQLLILFPFLQKEMTAKAVVES